MPRLSVQRSLREARIATYQEAILDAAQVLFSDHGYDAVKMADIARDAGVAKGTLYNYFTSKEAVFGALMDRSRAEIIETVRQATTNVGAADKPRAFLESFFGCLEEGAAMARVYMQVTGLALSHEADPHVAEGKAAFLEQVIAALQPMHEAGELRQGIALPKLALMFAGLAGSALEAWLEAGAEGSLVESIDDIVTIFFDGARAS